MIFPRTAAIAAAALALGAAAPALAQSKAPRAELVQKLIDCRAEKDSAARLACYDKAAAAFDEAEAKGDVVVVDRAQAEQARKQTFGLTLPSLDFLSKAMPGNAPLDRITASVDNAYRGQNGKWVIEIEGGAVWQQIDTENLLKAPKKGSKAEIRRVSLGSHFMNLDGQRAIRVSRLR